uniref:ABC transporter domain-containing protein n=1 Tax=Zooxanthella nutricula TaxID=1333877 RepID=A0A7S2QLK7_9DINO
MTEAEVPALEVNNLSYRYGGGATVHNRAFSEPKLVDVSCIFEQGCRVLVAGANGAGKSTLLSIMGGKKMVPRSECKVLGEPAFHGSAAKRMYCGDWWRTDFFFNLTVGELIGEQRMASPRVQELVDIMQINVSWRINAISDGQRRRCQLLDCLAEEKRVYILDEITTDLDLYAREGLLRFLRRETEEKGASVFYATHIFDSLADWATHMVFFSQAKMVKCCKMSDLVEYQTLVSQGARVPLYTLMRGWVFQEYDAPTANDDDLRDDAIPAVEGPVLDVTGLSYAYAAGLPKVLKDVTFSFGRGARILVVGANGACKSTVMSILGGKRMIPRGFAKILGKDCFNDPGVAQNVMYCGDWWRTNFFMNLALGELLGESVTNTKRCQHLRDVLQVNFSWKINDLSDGQRRRCQLLEILCTPRPVYLMDEITSDLDIFAREGILNFLRAESEVRGATIFYCTHIFDHLEGWASHLLHMAKGQVVKACSMAEVTEYDRLIAEGSPTPLYSMIRGWIYAEYEADAGAKPWRKLEDTSDGRRPNLGLAGPFVTVSG